MKNLEKRLEELKNEYQSVPIPEDGRERLKDAMQKAKEEIAMNERKNHQNKNHSLLRRFGALAAVLALVLALPNSNAQVARAMGELPVVGTFFRAVTVRQFQYEDEGASAQVEVPELRTNSDSSAAEQVNADAARYVDGLTEEFRSRVQELDGQAHTDLTVEYEVVTDTEDWLTLRLYAETVEASGAQYERYYNIDKAADKVVQLSDLFSDKEQGLKLVSEDIKRQMREQMKADDSVSYFLDSDIPEDDFQQVKDDQNFWLDSNGNLVVCFDEYEVAPGSMGLVQFTVERGVFADALAK